MKQMNRSASAVFLAVMLATALGCAAILAENPLANSMSRFQLITEK
jgi:hypothetical protein